MTVGIDPSPGWETIEPTAIDLRGWAPWDSNPQPAETSESCADFVSRLAECPWTSAWVRLLAPDGWRSCPTCFPSPARESHRPDDQPTRSTLVGVKVAEGSQRPRSAAECP
jgi:hypothetical protein